jgi:hypothetical protein
MNSLVEVLGFIRGVISQAEYHEAAECLKPEWNHHDG